MSDITNNQLLELVDETLAWAVDVCEMWTGTLYEKIIDQEQARLIKAIDQHDYELAYNLVHNLAQTLEAAEKEYEKEETNGYQIHTNSNNPNGSVR